MSKLEFGISLKLLSEKFSAGLNKVRGQLNKFKSSISGSFSTKGINDFNKSVNNLGSSFSTQMKKVSSSMDGINAKISGLGKAIAGAFALDKLIDFGKSIINVGASFQDQMARVQAVSNATKEEFEEMRKEAERLGATTRYSASEAAKALESLVRNGLKAKDATKALSGVLQLAGSQAIELSEAADIATAAMNGFGKEVTDLNRINDILAATCSNSATNVKELAEGLKVAAPIAKVLNISMEEVCAALGTFANVGIKGSQAGTALRIMLNRLVQVTPKGAEALKKYGLSISEADVKGQNFTKTLEKLAKANMSLADLKAIFGEEASSAAAALTGNYSGYTKTKTTVESSEGEAARQFEQGQGEFNKALAELSSSWEDLLNRFFQSNDGLFASLVKGVQTIVEELKKTSTYIMGLIAAIGIATGRVLEKTKAQTKALKAEQDFSLSKDIFGSIVAKGESNPNDPMYKTSGMLEARIKETEAYINKIESLLDRIPKAARKSAEEELKVANNYKSYLQMRLEAERQLGALEEVKEPVAPQKPRHYSEKVSKSTAAEDLADGIAGVADAAEEGSKKYKDWVKNAEDAQKQAKGTADKVGDIAEKTKAAAKGFSALSKAFRKSKAWFQNTGLFGRKKATGYYTGEDSKKREFDAYEKEWEIYQQDLAKYEEYIDKKKTLEGQLSSYERKSRGVLEDVLSNTGKSLDELKNLDPTEALEKYEQALVDIDKQHKGFWNNTKKGFKSLASFGANVLKGLWTAVGGWVGIASMAVGAAVKWAIDAYNEQHRLAKELREEQKSIINQYATMESKVMSLVNVMREHNKEEVAWKDALNELNSNYSDLFRNLDLEHISVESNAAEYAKLKERIKDVIAVQKEYMLNEQKRNAIQKLQEDFQNKASGYREKAEGIFATTGRHANGDKISKEAAIILAAQLEYNIIDLLSKGGTKDDITKLIDKEFKKYNVSNNSIPLYKVGGISGLAGKYYDKYQKYNSSIKSIEKLDSGYSPYPDKIINELVNVALEKFERDANNLKSAGKAKGETDEQINSAIESARQNILDNLIKDLQNVSSKVDGKDALTYAKDNKLFEALLKPLVVGKNGKLTTTTTTTTETTITGSGDSKTPKQLFDETKKYIDALKDAGVIKEKEYRERLLSAYDSYISGLESEKKTDDKSIQTLNDLIKTRDKLKKVIEEEQKADEHWTEITNLHAKVKEELAEKDKERLEQAKDIEKAGLKAKGRYDNYPRYNELNGVFANDVFEGSVIAPLEHDLQRLDDYLSDLQSIQSLEDINDQLKQIEGLKGEGVEALRGQLERLKLEIENAELAASDLDEKIQFRRAKKEIQDMTDEVGLMGYETVKGVFTTYDSLIRNLNEIGEKWDEMDFGEQMIQGIFGTIDAMISLAQMIKGLQEAWELLTFKKKALETAEAVSAQAGAAAVVAAEAEKTAAITGAVAAQTTAVLAAKTAQTKAATIAMAAESTAAYAGIPFAGVGLAAAQIAEMEALIAAAAALPMFAEGGIVGGTKYTGDQNLARVNSGEMIINRGQQKKLWDTISGGKYGSNNSLSGDVEFKISGQVLRGVLNNHDKKMSKIKG